MAENNDASLKNILSRQVTLDWNDQTKHGVETYSLELLAVKLHQLEDELTKEMKELTTRQKEVAFLQKFLRTVHAATDSSGNVDFTNNPEMKDMFAKAKELGAMIDETKLTYNTNERERLLENLRLTNEGLTSQNEMQFQIVNRLTNERLEAYQLARLIGKKLDDDKTSKARAISGR